MRLGQAASALAAAIALVSVARPATPEPNLPPRSLTHRDGEPGKGKDGVVTLGRRDAPWATSLEPLHVEWGNGPELACDVKLYADDGSLDPEAVAAFVRAVGGGPLAPRTVQLVVKAAYHFGVHR